MAVSKIHLPKPVQRNSSMEEIPINEEEAEYDVLLDVLWYLKIPTILLDLRT